MCKKRDKNNAKTQKTRTEDLSQNPCSAIAEIHLFQCYLLTFFLICTQYEEPMSYTEITINFSSLHLYFLFRSHNRSLAHK